MDTMIYSLPFELIVNTIIIIYTNTNTTIIMLISKIVTVLCCDINNIQNVFVVERKFTYLYFYNLR